MKTVGKYLATVLVVAIAFLGYRKYGERQDAKLVKWRADSTAVANATRAAVLASGRADTAYLKGETVYIRGRDRILRDTVWPPSAEVRACYAAADSLLSLCAARHATDSTEKAALRAELGVARAKPSERPPRFLLYGAGLYYVLHGAPVFQAGVEFRLLGGVHATAIGDLAIPPMGEARVKVRGLVGIRYVF